jgi:hypothetical protein
MNTPTASGGAKLDQRISATSPLQASLLQFSPWISTNRLTCQHLVSIPTKKRSVL